MQINSGLISINTAVNASLVNGDATVDWTQVTTSCLFIAQGQTYKITSVNAGAKTLTISPAWAGGTVNNIAYAIVRDFTLNQNLPLLNPGDLEAAAVFSRAMQLLDSIVGLTSSTTNEITVTVGAPTTFIVGNALGFNAAGWFLCRTDDNTKTLPIGMVTFVAADLLSFKIKTEGRITGIAGITLTAGNKYYLRFTPVAGGGQLVNLTDVTASAGSILVPVLIADGSNSGYLINLSSAQGAIFGAGTNGLVPYPGQGLSATPTINVAGSGYTVNDLLTISGGTLISGPAQVRVATVNGGGGVTSVTLVSVGNYSATPGAVAAVTGGTGTGCTLSVTWGTTVGVLQSDGTWKTMAITNGSIEAQHLQNSNATINWTNFATGTSTLSILKHIMDLQTRLLAIEGGSSGVTPTVPTDVKIAYNRQVFTWATPGCETGDWSVVTPAGVTQAIVTVIGAGPGVVVAIGSDLSKYRITSDGYFQSPNYYGGRSKYAKVRITGLNNSTLIGKLGKNTAGTIDETSVYVGSISVSFARAQVHTSNVINTALVSQYQAGQADPLMIAGIVAPDGLQLTNMPVTTYDIVELFRIGTPNVGQIIRGWCNRGIVIVEWGNGANVGVSL